MRSVDVSIVTRNIKEMCIQANHFLSEDMDIAMKNAVETEKAPLGKQILTQLQEKMCIRDSYICVTWERSFTHMKIVCNKSDLVKGVNIVSKAVPGKTTMPILE